MLSQVIWAEDLEKLLYYDFTMERNGNSYKNTLRRVVFIKQKIMIVQVAITPW